MGKVLVDGIDACLEQVKAGFAWHYKKYQHEQSAEDRELYADAENKARNESPEDQRLYADAEIRAREGRLGLWRENNPIPPWEHRRLLGESYQSGAF